MSLRARILAGLFTAGATQVPLEARILAVVDAYEAMTSDRSYSVSMGRSEACAELERCAVTQFDARAVEALMRLLERDAESAETALARL